MKTVIFGAGENAVQVYNILKHDRRYEVVGFLDDRVALHGSAICGIPVLGPIKMAADLRRLGQADAAIVAIGNNLLRERFTAEARELGYEIARAIHPHACIDETAAIGMGVIVEMGVMIHPQARIGDGVFLGGSSVIAHHSTVADFTLIGGGVVFGGGVVIGPLCTLGVGTVLQPHVTVGRGVTTGIGTAVTKPLPDYAVAVGVPAKIIRFSNDDSAPGSK